MKLASLLAVVLATVACKSGSSSGPATPASPTAAVSTTAQPGEDSRIVVGDLDGSALETSPPREARELLAAANELAIARATPEHTHVVGALERLADALELLVPARNDDILRVRRSATELARSGATATTHSNLVRDALAAAARSLDAVELPADAHPSSIHALRLREATLAVTNAADAIDPDAPLQQQYGFIEVAIRESTRAVFAALRAPEPTIFVHTASR